MLSKRLLITSVLISLIFHIAILGLASLVDISLEDNRNAIIVDLLKEPSKKEKPVAEKEKLKVSSLNVIPISGVNRSARPYRREDTISLDSMDIKYCSYLEKLREKIRRNWSYPKEAYIQKEEGTTVVKFSLAENGYLESLCMVASSGFNSLDMEALDVLRTSAPFDPLPKNFNLSKLNIVARFQYRLVE